MSSAMRATRWTWFVVLWSLVACAGVVPVAAADAQANTVCSSVLGNMKVAAPAQRGAWRANLEARTAVLYRLPGQSLRASRWLSQTDATSLLIVARPRAADDRCWVRVQLPWRPNGATGWINATHVTLKQTPWRIAISTARRTLTLFRAGTPVRTVQVVVGKPSTPTPDGLFAVVWAIPWHPNDFLGSWVLELTAHSNVLLHFEGGNGTVAIHGRGGTSLLDPLGSALSHGCIRLSNDSIDWLVNTVGANQLPGTPVRIS